MTPVSRSDRVADQLRGELALLISREVHDPGIGFVTLTRVQLSPDLQSARVYYTSLGDEAAARIRRARSGVPCRSCAGRSDRGSASSAVPELTFMYDDSIAGQDRIEQLLNEINAHKPDHDE